MIALRGILGRLGQAGGSTAATANAAALQLIEVLQCPEQGETFLIYVGLCLNKLSKQRVPVDIWRRLSQSTTPLLQVMPMRQLTLTLNAFARVSVPANVWMQEASEILLRAPLGSFSAQDISLALNAFARLAYSDTDVVLRLLRDVAPSRLNEFAPNGLVSAAHATARLGGFGGPLHHHAEVVRHTNVLLCDIASKLSRRVRKELRPLECALVIDAFTRQRGPLAPWAEVVIHDMAMVLVEALPHLGHREIVMVLTAFARRGHASDTGLADGLVAAFRRVQPALLGSELAVAVHASAMLNLAIIDEVNKWWDAPPTLAALTTCDVAHTALFLHGLAHLNLQPSYATWQLLGRCIDDLGESVPLNSTMVADRLDSANRVRIVLAAAKADWRAVLVKSLATAALKDLNGLGFEALGSLVYARLHPYYFDVNGLCVLLRHIAGRASFRDSSAASLAWQTFTGLVALQLLGRWCDLLTVQAPLEHHTDLLFLAERCSAMSRMTAGNVRSSTLQQEVQRIVERSIDEYNIAGTKKLMVGAEATVGPFSIDLTVYQPACQPYIPSGYSRCVTQLDRR